LLSAMRSIHPFNWHKSNRINARLSALVNPGNKRFHPVFPDSAVNRNENNREGLMPALELIDSITK
ncbi:hypothetical protein, partial [Photorhabdus hindustanensis]|uniref:hypothetical protein n=1 Tax=Photorhabdus hindustanensis TaxID=2918802 RepID=UPI001C611811